MRPRWQTLLNKSKNKYLEKWMNVQKHVFVFSIHQVSNAWSRKKFSILNQLQQMKNCRKIAWWKRSGEQFWRFLRLYVEKSKNCWEIWYFQLLEDPIPGKKGQFFVTGYFTFRTLLIYSFLEQFKPVFWSKKNLAGKKRQWKWDFFQWFQPKISNAWKNQQYRLLLTCEGRILTFGILMEKMKPVFLKKYALEHREKLLPLALLSIFRPIRIPHARNPMNDERIQKFHINVESSC